MPLTVAVLAPGAMGAGVGARLSDNGVQVLTALEGRSAASRKRAAAARMEGASDTELANADFVLSIVPPGDALPFAERLAPVLRAANTKPVYVDCNAVSPRTALRIAEVVEDTGCAFVDGGIIGGPPREGYTPKIYVSGPDARRTAVLTEHGLAMPVMDGAIGDASALKMCYGSLTKGLTALGVASIGAAARYGVAEALHAELAASQPALLAFLTRSTPAMFSKAYRWIAEMQEIASFFERDADRATYEGIAALYERVAQDHAGPQDEINALAAFYAKSAPAKTN